MICDCGHSLLPSQKYCSECQQKLQFALAAFDKKDPFDNGVQLHPDVLEAMNWGVNRLALMDMSSMCAYCLHCA